MNDSWISIRVPAPLKERLTTVARQEKRTVSGQAEYFIEKALDEDDRNAKQSGQEKELQQFMEARA